MERDDADSRGDLLHEGPRHRSRQDGQARRSQEGRLHPLLQAEHSARRHRSQGQQPLASAPACSRRSNTPRFSTFRSPTVPTATPSWSTTAPATSGTVEREIPLDQFPAPEELWARYRAAKGYTAAQEAVATQDYYDDGSGKSPRYYQLIAINRTVDAIARGENRILLVMATGTGKTYTAFQIIWRLWKSGAKKRILFLVDRNILADQTKTNDFKPFGQAMTKITNRTVDKASRSTSRLYQAVTGTEEEQNIYKQFSPDFFDLVVVDECHRGSAADDAAWRKVLEYFSSATQIGLTATPKETEGRLQHRLLRRADLHLLAPAGHRRRLPRPLQSGPHRPRQRPRRLAAREGQDRQIRPGHRGPRVQRHSTSTAT